jgi:hypothetical protein
MPEGEHEQGRTGVKRVKRLLEASMRFRLPYDAYEHAERVTLPLLSDKVKTFDLVGDHLDETGSARTPIYVESKNVKDAGAQGAEFAQFLAHAYSATRRAWDGVGMDPRWEFMWATTCPWKGSGFRDVGARDAVRIAVRAAIADDVIPAAHKIDDDLVQLISDRGWIWVVSDRHEDMTISDEMQGWIAEKLRVL